MSESIDGGVHDTPELNPDIRVFDGDSLQPGSLNWDMLLSAVPFSGLLGHCVETYLDDPERYSRSLSRQVAARLPDPATVPGGHVIEGNSPFERLAPIDPSEAALLRRLGVGGINAAAIHIQTVLGPRGSMADAHWADAAVRRPDLFSRPVDDWTAKRLKAFGEAYMAAMYGTLGVEAPSAGTTRTVDDQMEALDSVFYALQTIGRRDGAPALGVSQKQLEAMLTEEDELGRPYYDPLLLSAAVYPNNQEVLPNCAARMAMVAGFCEAAGWPQMTATTLVESDVYVLQCLGRLTSKTGNLFKDNSLPIHPMDLKALRKTERVESQYSSQDRGFHGCNLVRLNDGRWWQIDMTWGIYEPYTEDYSSRLDIVYDNLRLGDSARLPLTAPFNTLETMDIFDFIADAAADTVTRLRHPDDIASQLNKMVRLRQLTIDQLVDDIILPVVLPDGNSRDDPDDSGRQDFDRLILRYLPTMLRSDAEGLKFVRQAARGLLTKQAFMTPSSIGMSAMAQPHRILHGNRTCHDGCLRKTVDSPDARQFLVHWLRTAPLMLYQKLANDYAKHLLQPDNFPAHPALELSSPAMQLATIVLSADSAIYGDGRTKLPAAWWPTFDPTHYGSLVHMQDAEGTGSLDLMVNGIGLLRRLPTDCLLPPSKADRIRTFLGRHERTTPVNGMRNGA